MDRPPASGRSQARVVLAPAVAASLLAGCGAAASAPPGPSGVSGAPGATTAPTAAAPRIRTRVETLHSTQPPHTATLHVPELVWPGHRQVGAGVNGRIDSWVKGRVDGFAARVTRDLLAFPAGQYTAAYCGPPTVTIPASSLRDLLAAGGPLAPAAG